jgi:MHS family proline/betaine transporter-like MFS transporter
LVVTWLIGATGDPISPAWYVTAATLVSIIAILALPASTQPSAQYGQNLR